MNMFLFKNKVIRFIVLFFLILALINLFVVKILHINPLIELKYKYLCVGEGEVGNYFKGNKCCPNLKNVVALSVINKSGRDYSERCIVSGGGGAFLCTRCGNNNCERFENECNCPMDCLK